MTDGLCIIRFYVFFSKLTWQPVYVGSTNKTLKERNNERLKKGEGFGNYLTKNGPENFVCILWEEKLLPKHCQERWDIENRLMDDFKTWHKFGTGGQNFARAGGITREEQFKAFREMMRANAIESHATGVLSTLEMREAARLRFSGKNNPIHRMTKTQKKRRDRKRDKNRWTLEKRLEQAERQKQNPPFATPEMILKRREEIRPRSEVPKWALNDETVRCLLLTSFPKMETNPTQRERAGRWLRVIQLYYRMWMSSSEVAQEMGLSVSSIRTIIRSLRWAAEGKTATGKIRGLRPSGRPRRLALVEPSLVETKIKHDQQ